MVANDKGLTKRNVQKAGERGEAARSDAYEPTVIRRLALITENYLSSDFHFKIRVSRKIFTFIFEEVLYLPILRNCCLST